MSWESLLGRVLLASLELPILFVLLALVIRGLPVRNPRTRSLLWLALLAKPLLTLSGLTLIPLAQFDWIDSPDSRPLEAGSGPWSFSLDPSDPTSSSSDPQTSASTDPTPALPIDTTLAITWLTGVLGLLAWAVVQQLQLHRLLVRSSRPGRPLLALYRSTHKSLGLPRAPRILVSPDLDSPALVGVLRTVVLLPGWMADESPRDQIRWVLKHELRHWMHRDPLAGSVRWLSQTLFFFHPLVWWLGRLWEEATEMACDRSVVRSHEQAHRYAETLFDVLLRVRARKSSIALHGLNATRTQIGKRIQELLDNPSPTRNPVHVPWCLVPLTGVLLSVGVALDGDGIYESESDLRSQKTLSSLPPSEVPGLGSHAKNAVQYEVEVETIRKGRDLNLAEDAPLTQPMVAKPGSQENRLHLDLTLPGRHLEILGRGSFSLDADLVRLDPSSSGGHIRVRDQRRKRVTLLEIAASRSGDLTRSFTVDGHPAPFDEDARAWLREVLDHFPEDFPTSS